MSQYFSKKLSSLTPYVPGEQPQDKQYVKLNTNENPYFPTKYAIAAITEEEKQNLRLYSDPECAKLSGAIANFYGVDAANVLATNGSDEALAFCFAAFGEGGCVFPDITYGFYKVFAALFDAPYQTIALKSDFTVDTTPYLGCGKTVFLANPNAQTGIYLPLKEIEKIVKSNPDNVVVVDEAYVDFGGESAVPLTKTYSNLVVVQTFSKSRSLAGARVGFAIACKQLIADLMRVKYAFNPYNVNRLSLLLATKAIEDTAYFTECCQKIKATRARLTAALTKLGFKVLPSSANFVLAETEQMGGEELYLKLKQRGVLVRHFADERIKNYVRITIGTEAQTDILLSNIKQILGGQV